MKAFVQLFIANAKELLRDPMAIFWFLAFPVLFILLFGAIFSENNDTQKFNIGLVIEDQGELGKGLETAFTSVSAFTITKDSRDNELAALKEGKRSLVVVIPSDLSASAVIGATSKVLVYYDQSQQLNNQVLLSSVEKILDETERQITQRPRILEIQPEGVQAVKLRNIDYLLPGILAMALMQLGLFGSLNLVSLRERKILKQLGATPLPRSLLIGSEVAVRLIMAIFQTLVIIVIGRLVFDVTIIGNYLYVLGFVVLGAATFVSLGYMLVSFAKTEESGQGIIQVVQFPMMFLAGIFFPVTIMPGFLQPVIKAIPLTYLADALRQIMTGSVPLHSLSTDLSVMLVWFAVTLILAIRFFQWE